MWKVLCYMKFMAFFGLVISDGVSKNSSLVEKLIQNKTNEEIKIVKQIESNVADEGSALNPFDPVNLTTLPNDESLGNFKYYFLILFVSSLSVVSIIAIKTFRLRKSRAELKYGIEASTTDRSETEPLGRSKWLEESSDENEDEIFDINFLKNSRTQNAV